MYLLMRQWGSSKTAGIFSGIVFMFSGYMVSVINLLASLASAIWFPVVLLFFDRYLKSKRFKDLIFLSIFLSFMFLGGEPIILYITILILFIISLVKKSIKGFILSLILFLGIIGFQALPFLELILHSTRLNLEYSEASMWSFPIYGLTDFLIPFFSETDFLFKNYWTRQSWLLVYYIGLGSILFSLVACLFDVSKKRVFIFFLLIVGLLISMGRNLFLYPLMYRFLPGFGLSRYPIKFFFLVAFSIAILAGIGIDSYKRNLKYGGFARILLFLGLVASFLYLILELNLKEMSRPESISEFIFVNLFNLKRQLGLFSLLSLLFFLGLKGRKNFILGMIVFISTVDLFTTNQNLYINQKSADFLRPSENIEFIRSKSGLFRIFTSPLTSSQNTFVPERDYIAGMENLKERFVSNRMMSFGIYDANGYGSIYRKRHQRLVESIMKQRLPDESNLLSLLNVRYVISPKVFEAEGFKLVKEGGAANIYENLKYLPRAFLAEEAVILKDEKEILKQLMSKGFDPRKKVIIEEVGGRSSEVEASPFASEYAEVVKYEPEEVIIEAEVNSPKFLVLSDSFYPGWKVYVDGKIDKIYRAYYILRAVYLKQGIHKIRFIYSPFSFKIGVVITLVTIVIIILSLFK